MTRDRPGLSAHDELLRLLAPYADQHADPGRSVAQMVAAMPPAAADRARQLLDLLEAQGTAS